jgi:hypothetical protein
LQLAAQTDLSKEIDFVMTASSEEDKAKELDKLKHDIEDACVKRKISEMHYNLLNKKRVSCKYEQQ